MTNKTRTFKSEVDQCVKVSNAHGSTARPYTLDELYRAIREHTFEALGDLNKVELPIVNTSDERLYVLRALAELKAAVFDAERFLARL